MSDDELRQQFGKIDAQFEKIGAQFLKIDAQFEKVDAQFLKIDAQFEKVDARFDRQSEEINARFEQQTEDMRQIETNLLTAFHNWSRPMEIRQRNTSNSVSGYDERLSMVEERLGKLEAAKDK